MLPSRIPFPRELLTFPRTDYSYAWRNEPRFRTADVTDVLLAKAAFRSSRVFESLKHGTGRGEINARIFTFAVLDKVIQLNGFLRLQELADPWPVHRSVEHWRSFVDVLIEIAYGLADAHLKSILPLSHDGERGAPSTPLRIPPLPMLQLLLRECMEWFWCSSDSVERNRDPYPRLNLKVLLGPLYRRPTRVADREKGLKMIGLGRFLRPRKPLVDCKFFDDDVLASDPVVDTLAKLHLADCGSVIMDTSA